MQQGYLKCESNKNNSVCDIAQWKVSLLSKRLKNKLQLVLGWHIWQITHKKRMCALSLAKTKQPTQISGKKALKRVSASFELCCDDLVKSLVYDAPMLWPHNFSDSFIGSSLSIFHASNASPLPAACPGTTLWCLHYSVWLPSQNWKKLQTKLCAISEDQAPSIQAS